MSEQTWPEITENQWNLISTSKTYITLYRLKSNFKFYITSVLTGQAAPADNLKSISQVLFEKNNFEEIFTETLSDFYIWIENSDSENDETTENSFILDETPKLRNIVDPGSGKSIEIKNNPNSGSNEILVNLEGHKCPQNTTNTPLGIDEVFTGTGWQSTLDYGVISIDVNTDQDSAIDGLVVQWSHDGDTIDNEDIMTIFADTPKTFTFGPANQYVRLKYTNGSVAQGIFSLQTLLRRVYVKPSSHRITDSIVGQDDAELVKAVLTGLDIQSNVFENIKSFGGALNVTDGYAYKRPLTKFIQRDSGGATNPSTAISSGDRTVTFDSITGFAIGDFVDLHEGIAIEMQPLIITAISGNDVTFNRPINFSYTTAANLNEIDINMNKLGTPAAPLSYKIQPPAGQIWQFTRFIVTMLATTTMDDGKFGGIPKLPNGAILSTFRSGIKVTAAVWQTNGDIANDMYDITYSPKAPAGQYGLRGRWTITNLGAIVELNGDSGDYAEFLIQDDLTGLDNFSVKGQGRIFGN